MANPKQLQNLPVSLHKVGSSIAALHVVQLDSTGGIVSGGAGGGSTQVSVREILTAAGNTVIDSTNNSVGVTIRAGSAAGTEYTDGDVDASVSGGAILFDNSSNTLRPVTISRGLPVNVVAGSAGSTEATIRQSTVGDLRAAVYQSTAADLNVTVAGYSTTVNVSSVGGAVNVRSSAANALVTVYQSTAADLNATVVPASTTWAVQARPVLPTLLSTTQLITSTHSTAVYELISSAAGVRHKVYAYFVGSTHTNPSTLVFFSSAAGGDHWPVNFGSGSSGITGANLAVTPPGFLFGSVVANALNVRIEGGSSATATVVARIGFSYFSEA